MEDLMKPGKYITILLATLFLVANPCVSTAQQTGDSPGYDASDGEELLIIEDDETLIIEDESGDADTAAPPAVTDDQAVDI